jgi:hypothetical protein
MEREGGRPQFEFFVYPGGVNLYMWIYCRFFSKVILDLTIYHKRHGKFLAKTELDVLLSNNMN